MKLSLMVTEGFHAGQVIPVGGVSLLIGRGPQCHLRPNSPAVAERHCNLTIRAQRAFVRDLDSSSGTFVNDRQLRGEIELRDGDFLRIGPLVFVIQLEADAVAERTPSENLSALDGPLPEGSHLAAETQEMPAFVPEPLPEESPSQVPALAGAVPDLAPMNGVRPPAVRTTWTGSRRRPRPYT